MNTTVIVPEIQIDFENIHDAKTMQNYVDVELNLKSSIIKGNVVSLSIYDVPENKLNIIRRRMAIENFSKSTVKVINSTRDAIVGAADFATYRVAAPIAQASIKASAGIAKVAAKAALATSATLIGSTIENARRTGQELKTDPEVLHAKEELSGAYKAVKNMFGFTGSSNSDIRIIIND